MSDNVHPLTVELANAVRDLGGLDRLDVDRLGAMVSAASQLDPCPELSSFVAEIEAAWAVAIPPDLDSERWADDLPDLASPVDWTSVDELAELVGDPGQFCAVPSSERFTEALAAARDTLAALTEDPDEWDAEAEAAAALAASIDQAAA